MVMISHNDINGKRRVSACDVIFVIVTHVASTLSCLSLETFVNLYLTFVKGYLW